MPSHLKDSDLRMRGTDGLRVADRGVIPTITGGNTHSPTSAFIETALGRINVRYLGEN